MFRFDPKMGSGIMVCSTKEVELESNVTLSVQ